MRIEKLKFLLAVAIFGCNGLILHFIGLPAVIVVLFRVAIGPVFLILAVTLQRKKVNWQSIKKNIFWLAVSGIALGLNWVFLFSAYSYISIAVASLIDYMAPMFVILISPFVYKEKLGLKKLLCVITAFAGIVMASGIFGGEQVTFNAVGVLLASGSAVCFVILLMCNKKLKEINGTERAISQVGFAAIPVVPVVIFIMNTSVVVFDTQSVLLAVLMGVLNTGIAYLLYLGSMAKLPVQTVALFGYVEPALSVFISLCILHEPVGIIGLIGAFMVLGGAFASEFAD